METETKTLTGGVQVHRSRDGDRTVLARHDEHVALTHAALQELVQYAYDTHGMLASPSYALEAERATEPKPGQCPCGTEGCSDRDATEPDPTRDALQRVFA